MGSVADSVAAKIRIIFDNTNFLTRKITQKWFSWTYLYLIMLNQTLKLRFVRQIKSFSKQNYYLCSVYTHTGSLDGQRLGRHIYIKGVTVRFGFDLLELRKLSTVRQRQSNGNASWGVLYTVLIGFGRFYCSLSRVLSIYLHWRGAFGVARFGRTGQCEGLNKWNG